MRVNCYKYRIFGRQEIYDKEISEYKRPFALYCYVFLRMTWIVSTLLLVAAYNGNLRASLIIPSYEKMPQSIYEIIERYNICVSRAC